MGKYYCDYCDVFLTHDSASVRRAHNAGRNHLSNVRDYYASLGNDRAQELIDQIVRSFETGQRGPGQARILQMTAEGLPVGMSGMGAGGAPLRFANPASAAPPPGAMGGGPPPGSGPGTPMGGGGGPPPMRFGSGPIPAQPQFGSPMGAGPPGMGMGGPPGMGGGGFGGPPPPGFGGPGGAPAPPPGFRPPPGFPMSSGPGGPPPPGFNGPPGGGAGGPPPPAPAPAADGAPPAKLINGLNPERARMLGLI
ncbi:hypothetical protein JCM8097_004618 [Rhodosporidiobolus ruineniae]